MLRINPSKTKLSLFEMRQLLSKIPDVRAHFLDQGPAPIPSVKDPGINNNNNFINLLKKAFQLL